MLRWNISTWGAPVMDLFQAAPADIICLCETHLMEENLLNRTRRQVHWLGYTTWAHQAIPSDPTLAPCYLADCSQRAPYIGRPLTD